MASEKFEAGMKVRRAVLGDAYVDNALASADAFSLPMQEMATEMAWGTVWTRPDLPRKTRSLVVIGMLIALNRPHELRLHLRAALGNDCSREEIREVLLQAAAYCGVPAGIDAFRAAREVFAEADRQAPKP